MKRFAEIILRFRFGIVALALVATGLALLQLPKVRLESDIVRYMPQDDPDVLRFDEIGAIFGNNHIGMVALELPEVFSHEGLTLIRDLTAIYQATEGVESVISLTNMMDFRAAEDTIEVVKLVDPEAIPESPEALAALRKHAMSKETVRGGIVSEDGKVALIVCNFGSDRRGDLTARDLMQKTEARVPDGVTVYFAGFPMTIVSINDLIMGDMRLLIPLVALVILGVLFAMFRTVRGVVLPLGTVGLATVWAVGVMTYLGYPITMVSAIMPVVLLAVGSAYGIHMVSRYNEDAARSDDPATVVTAAMRAVALPIIAAGLTTFIGFATLATATMTIIRDFGILTALGVVLGLLASITLIPVLLSILPVRGARATHEEAVGPIDTLLSLCARAVQARPGLFVLLALAIGAAGAAGLPRIRTDVNMLTHFPKESIPRRSEELLQARFGGSAPLFLDVQGDLKDPWVLKNLRRFGLRIDALEGAARPQSIADVLADLNFVMNGERRVPDTREEIGNLWFFLDGQDLIEQMVNGTLDRGVLQARVDSHDTRVMASVADAVNAMLARASITSGARTLPEGAARRAWVLDGIDAVFARRTLRPVAAKQRQAIAALLDAPETHAAANLRPAPAPAIAWALTYLASDEAEVELGETERALAGAALQARLATPGWSVPVLTETLREALAGTEAARDPEGLMMMAESMVAGVAQRSDAARIARIAAKIVVLLRHDDATLREDVEAELWDLFAPATKAPATAPTTFTQTGLHQIMLTLNIALVRNQMESIALALVFVLVLMVAQFRSLFGGLLAMIPIAMATLVSFGVMAFADIPLDMATAMIASVTIGIGIDYTIHFLSRYKKEAATGQSTELALRAAIRTTGRAILVNTLSVALGFLVLMLSGMIPLRHFGALVALNMFLCAAGALTTLPATILLTRGRFFRARAATKV